METHRMLFRKCVASFQRAATEFGVDITAPFRVAENGSTHTAIAFLPSLGSEHGMIVSSIAPPDFQASEFFVEYAARHNLYISHVNIES